MSGGTTLWSDLEPEPAPEKAQAEQQEAILGEGFITDIITGEKQVKDTAKEQVRQFIARALHEQYNISYEDMHADFKIYVDDGEHKRRVNIDIAIFHQGQIQDEKHLSRAVVCKPEPQSGKSIARLRTPEEADKDVEEVKVILRNISSCEYGLWGRTPLNGG